MTRYRIQEMTAAARVMAEGTKSLRRVFRVAMPRRSVGRAKALAIRPRFRVGWRRPADGCGQGCGRDEPGP
jgi:hypothetical protein